MVPISPVPGHCLSFTFSSYTAKQKRLMKIQKTSSFKSSENIQKKEGGLDRSASENQSPSVTLIELAIKARKTHCNPQFSNEV